MSRKLSEKPSVTAVMLTAGDYGYAWVGHAMKIDVWEKVLIGSKARRGSAEWNAAAFAACLAAYRRLQQRMPGVDMSLSTGQPPAGMWLPLTEITSSTMRCLLKTVPELLPPVMEFPAEWSHGLGSQDPPPPDPAPPKP